MPPARYQQDVVLPLTLLKATTYIHSDQCAKLTNSGVKMGNLVVGSDEARQIHCIVPRACTRTKVNDDLVRIDMIHIPNLKWNLGQLPAGYIDGA